MTDTSKLIERAEKALQSEGRLDDYHLCEIRRVDLQELLAALKKATSWETRKGHDEELAARYAASIADRDALAAKLKEVEANPPAMDLWVRRLKVVENERDRLKAMLVACEVNRDRLAAEANDKHLALDIANDRIKKLEAENAVMKARLGPAGAQLLVELIALREEKMRLDKVVAEMREYNSLVYASHEDPSK